MKKNNKGFTLVELIIVIAILAIIMLIAIPNFSGIQQRMQVRADKATAAQIGKAVRIWYTEYNSDPAFKATVGTTAGTNNTTAQGFIGKPGEAPVQIAFVKNLSGYVDDTLVPTSLRTTTGTSESAQKYFVGLTGAGQYEKVVVCIANPTGSDDSPVQTIPANCVEADVTGASPAYPGKQIGMSKLNAKSSPKYDGNRQNAAVTAAGSDAVKKFEVCLAYMEP